MNPSHLLAVLGTCSKDQLHKLRLHLPRIILYGNSFCLMIIPWQQFLLQNPSTWSSHCWLKYTEWHTWSQFFILSKKAKWKTTARACNNFEVKHCIHLYCLMALKKSNVGYCFALGYIQY